MIKKIVTGFLLVLILCFGFFLGTHTGLTLIIDGVNRYSSTQISYDTLSGRLLSRIDAKNLNITSPELSISNNEASMSWHLFSLFLGKVHIEKLIVHGLKINITPHSPPQSSARQSASLIPIKIDKIDLRDINIQNQNRLVTIGRINGHLSLSNKIEGELVWKSLTYKERNNIITLSGKGNLAGIRENYQYSLQTDIQTNEAVKGNLILKGTGSQQKASIKSLTLSTPKGLFEGKGDIQWDPLFTTLMNINIKSFNPGIINEALEGKLTGNVRIQKESGASPLSIDIQNIKGDYRKNSLSIRGKIDITPNSISFNPLHLFIQDQKLVLNGTLSHTMNLSWDIQFHNLRDIFPTLHGAIESRGSFKGTMKHPIIKMQIEGSKLHYRTSRIQSLSADINLSLLNNHQSSLSVIGKNIHVSNHKIHTLTLKGSGTPLVHHLYLTLSGHKTTLNMHLTGQLDDQWKGVIQSIDITQEQHTPWTLKNPTSFEVSNKSFGLSELCLQNNLQSICTQVSTKKNESFHSNITIKQFDLRFLNSLSKTIALHGQLNGALNINQSKDNMDALGHFSIKPLNINIAGSKPQKLYIPEVSLNVTQSSKGATLEGFVALENGRPLNIQLSLPQFNPLKKLDRSQKIEGALSFSTNQFELTKSLFPEIENISGLFDMNIQLEGTVDDPVAKGNITLKNGQVKIPKLGLNITDIQTHVHSSPVSGIILKTSLTSTNPLSIESVITLHPSLQVEYKIKGENVTFIDNKQFKIIASPHLHGELKNNIIYIRGEVTIPEALIRPTNYRSTTTLSHDVVFVDELGEPEHQHESLNLTNIDMKATLGDNVQLEYAGFKTHLGGSLTIKSTPNQLPTGYGTITLNKGSYTAYGQDLQINNGRFTFDGPLINPQLNLTAVRRVKTSTQLSTTAMRQTSFKGYMTVGIRIIGTLNNPEMTLFSDPAGISQSDILSYIIIGLPQSQASNAQGALLLQAANSLTDSSGKGTSAGSELKERFGITEFGIESGQVFNPVTNRTQSNTSFVIGKNISEDLSVKVSQGLLIPISVLFMNYEIDRHWMLQGDVSSLGFGTDLIYSIERGD